MDENGHEGWRARAARRITQFFGWLSVVTLMWGVGLSILTSAFILGNQALDWLREGYWTPYPLIQLMLQLEYDMSAVYEPQEWIGLAAIAAWILDLPVAVALPAGGIIISLLVAGLFEGLSD